MLNYEVIGPIASGKFLVAYTAPGWYVRTVACVCATIGQAEQEAARLNDVQRARAGMVDPE